MKVEMNLIVKMLIVIIRKKKRRKVKRKREIFLVAKESFRLFI